MPFTLQQLHKIDCSNLVEVNQPTKSKIAYDKYTVDSTKLVCNSRTTC